MHSTKSGLTPTVPSRVPRLNRPSNRSLPCDNYMYGCCIRLSSPAERLIHKDLCQFEPNSSARCLGCHQEMQRSQLQPHNCVEELRRSVDQLKDMITGLETKVNEQSLRLTEAKQLLDASPQLILTHKLLKDKWYEWDDNQHKSQLDLVFESEPVIASKEKSSHLSNSSEVSTQVKPKVSPNRKCFERQRSQTDVQDFPMYGSVKYRELAQLSRDYYSDNLPPIDYQLDQSLDPYTHQTNKQQLIDVCKTSVSNELVCLGDKPSLVRLRSWSDRHSHN